VAADAEHADAIRLAGLIAELSRQDEAGRQLAIEILGSLTRFVAGRAGRA
jgi:hypothetical protein